MSVTKLWPQRLADVLEEHDEARWLITKLVEQLGGQVKIILNPEVREVYDFTYEFEPKADHIIELALTATAMGPDGGIQ